MVVISNTLQGDMNFNKKMNIISNKNAENVHDISEFRGDNDRSVPPHKDDMV